MCDIVPTPYPMDELGILQTACQILIDIADMPDVDKQLISQQTRNVLLHGTRHAMRKEESTPLGTTDAGTDVPIPYDLDEETLRTHIPGYEAIYFPVATPEPTPGTAGWAKAQPPSTGTLPQAFYDALGNFDEGTVPGYEDAYFPAGTPEPEGFTIPARVEQLLYDLTNEQCDTHLPRITKLARESWARQFAGEPAHKDGADWYDISDARWIDPLIHTYLATFPGLAQLPGEGM